MAMFVRAAGKPYSIYVQVVQGRQSVLKSEGDRLENEEFRGYASLIFLKF